MSNRDVHKVILGLLEDPSIPYHSALLTLLYNLVYKHSAALRLYRRTEVVEVVREAVGKVGGEVAEGLLSVLESREEAD